MSDLVAFLNARLDEDEALARAATQARWQSTETAEEDRAVVCIDHRTVPGAATVLFESDWGTLADASHMAEHDPARVLREVDAKRKILSLLAEDQAALARGYTELVRGAELAGLAAAWAFAAVYSDHPDYDPAWGGDA